MNKYVLIPHEQYESFKKFLADKKRHINEKNKQKTNEENNSINPISNETTGENLGSVISNNILDKKSENSLDNNPENLHSTQSREIKSSVNHPLPPPGLPSRKKYTENNFLSKISKNVQKIQKGSGNNEWIKQWSKKF